MIVNWCVKRKETPVCLPAVKNYQKVESINKENYYETTSKKLADIKKNLFCKFCKSV